VPQGPQLLFEARHPDRRLDHQSRAAQGIARLAIEGAGLEGVEREGAPQHSLAVQAGAHAVMHWQGLADLRIEQAVVGIGEFGSGLEADRSAPRQDGRETRVVADDEATSQGLARQPVDRDRPQAVSLQSQQADCATGELLAQRTYQPLQANRMRQVGGEICQEDIVHKVNITL
jgi:hypothetical protein